MLVNRFRGLRDHYPGWVAGAPPVLLAGFVACMHILTLAPPTGTDGSVVGVAAYALLLASLMALLLGAIVTVAARLPAIGLSWLGAASSFVGSFLVLAAFHEAKDDHVPGCLDGPGTAAAWLLVASVAAVAILGARRGWRQTGVFSMGLGACVPLLLCAPLGGGFEKLWGLAPVALAGGLLLGRIIAVATRSIDSYRPRILLVYGAACLLIATVAQVVEAAWAGAGALTPAVYGNRAIAVLFAISLTLLGPVTLSVLLRLFRRPDAIAGT